MRTNTTCLALLTSLVGAIALGSISPGKAASPPTSVIATTAIATEGSRAPIADGSAVSSHLHSQVTDNSAIVLQAQATPNIPAQVSNAPVQILAPTDATELGDRTTNLVVRYGTGTTVSVRINGKPIDPATATQSQTNDDGTITQVWYSLPLGVGENTLTVQPTGGTAVSTKVRVKELAAKLIFIPNGNPRIPADGRSALTLEGQIVDDAGEVLQQDAIVTLTASAGSFVGTDQDKDRPGFQVVARNGKFTAQLQAALQAQKVQVRAAVRLLEPKAIAPGSDDTPVSSQQELPSGASNRKPATQTPLLSPDISPTVPLESRGNSNSPLADTVEQLEAYTQIEFITDLRRPIVAGSVNIRIGAGGTDFYNSFRNFLNPDLLDDDVRVDFSSAIFATGRVGSWLITGAFNNQRPLNEACDGNTSLFRSTQFCDQPYPVYGDSSTSEYLAPSIDSVYFRAERTSPVAGAGTDYFMWGDYTSAELATPSQFYTATDRQLHGFKGNFNLGNFQITALYANNVEGFQRDTIVPNGTSGYYFLSQRLLVPGSETIAIESEELNRPGTVVERKELSRSSDYEVDYDRGTILFRRPVLQTDFDLFGRTLVRRIVVTYQYEGTGSGSLYAGRVQYNFSREFGLESWLGISYLNEDQGDRTFELYGVDAWIPLGKTGRLIAEIARSSNDSIFRGEITGTALRFEAYGPLFKERLFGRAYYRTVDEDFANNATFSFTPGQTRYGAEVVARLSPTTRLQAQVDHEENFGIATQVLTNATDLFNPSTEPIPGVRVNNKVTTLRAGIVQKLGAADLSLDFVSRSRSDRATDQLDQDSTQLVSRFNLPLTKTLTFRAQNELNLGGDDPIYPDRTTVGLDWAIYPGITARLAQQFLSSTSQFRSNSITQLDVLMDHKLSENTTVTGRYSVLNGISGFTTQGAIGLNHRILLGPGLKLNLGYERIFGDIFAYTTAGQQFAQPYATGQSAASLGVTEGDSFNVGVEYSDNPNFKVSARVEYRSSEVSDSLVISAGAAGKLTPALTALVRYQQANFANQLIEDQGLGDTISLKAGIAYRDPTNDKFNVLARYEFRQNPSTLPNDILVFNGTSSSVHLFAVEALYAPNWRWEFYAKYALRDTKEYLSEDLTNENTISLTQLRAAYRFAYRWDVAGEIRFISQSLVGFDEMGLTTEVGYYLTPNLRLAAGYSFGEVRAVDFGDRDKGGFFVNLSLKLNDLFGFGVQPIAPPQQRESEVKPIAAETPPPQASLIVPPAAATPKPAAEPVAGGQE